jgi:DNA-binding response OmpR family regulator
MSQKVKMGKVLIVDDNTNMAGCLADMIEEFNVRCDTVSDGEEAIQRLAEESYALVIADTRMPKVSGFTLLKYIKKNHPQVPVALISTRDSELTQQIAVRDGADFYLPKPFTTEKVGKLLSQLG